MRGYSVAKRKLQQDDLEARQEEVFIDHGDASTSMPAARCRECLTLTWRVSLRSGLWPLPNPKHRDGCSQPEGRFDRMQREGTLYRLHEAMLNRVRMLP